MARSLSGDGIPAFMRCLVCCVHSFPLLSHATATLPPYPLVGMRLGVRVLPPGWVGPGVSLVFSVQPVGVRPCALRVPTAPLSAMALSLHVVVC